jgi:uncharacterized membrane protein
MKKAVSMAVVVLLAGLAVFFIFQPLLPPLQQPGQFSQLGVLGQTRTFGSYPSEVFMGQPFLLYGFVGNHEGTVKFYEVLVKLGNMTTQISNVSSADALTIENYSHVLDNNQSWIFPMNLTIYSRGDNQRLIFELWKYDQTVSRFVYSGKWVQIWVNVTAS